MANIQQNQNKNNGQQNQQSQPTTQVVVQQSQQQTPPPEPPQVQVQTEVTPGKMKKVKIRKTVNRMRYGPQWYQFVAGREYVVDEHLARHLDEKGII